eukprot:TRINITY_DN67034_c0_g1_i1.p1 TRINITY_DN67034_c0_g1~~TRINITY_DN67034_c0_g1_i1.p1  ORF type:complete len:297 (+),score=61.77 TRINITY_DN67034_c0_g1_i1:28-918(+)
MSPGRGRVELPLLLLLTVPRCVIARQVIDPQIYENMFQASWPMFEKMTEKVLAVGATHVLDIGTGYGQPAILMAQILPAASVTGIERQDAIQLVKKRSKGLKNLNFHVSSAEDLSAFQSQSLDAVTMSFALTSVKDRAKALQEVVRVLRPGGSAFVSVWKKHPLLVLAAEAIEAVTNEMPKQLPVNPAAIQKEGIEELVEVTNGLLSVDKVEALEYPMHLGTTEETCDAALTLVGPLVQKLKIQGKKDAQESFCRIFISKLDASGMKTTRDVFEVSGFVAELLTLRRASHAQHTEL